MSLFAAGVILCSEYPNNTIRKLLQLINQFAKVPGYKIDTRKFVEFLHTNKLSEREVKEIISLKLHQNKLTQNKFN